MCSLVTMVTPVTPRGGVGITCPTLTIVVTYRLLPRYFLPSFHSVFISTIIILVRAGDFIRPERFLAMFPIEANINAISPNKGLCRVIINTCFLYLRGNTRGARVSGCNRGGHS